MNLSKVIFSVCLLLFFSCGNDLTSQQKTSSFSTTNNSLQNSTLDIFFDSISTFPKGNKKFLPPENYKSDQLLSIGWELMTIESFGNLKIEMDTTTIINLIGTPDTITSEVFWGADGGWHSEWHYDSLGIILDMMRIEGEENSKNNRPKHINQITIDSTSSFCSSRNICIGSSREQVQNAYQKAIANNSKENSSIVAGTVYGGIIFDIKDGKVVKIFIGATAE